MGDYSECGRKLILLNSIKGRQSDIIKRVNGNRDHGEFFCSSIRKQFI